MRTFLFFQSIILIGILMTSCDPSCDGTMKLTNGTDSTLTFVIEKNGYFESDSIYYFDYQFTENSKSKIYGDSLLIVECKLEQNQELELFYEGPIGSLDLDDKENGLFRLNEITDTIYLKNALLKKDVKNMDNWDIYVDKSRNGGGESVFNFIVTNDDIENY